jgi:predicted branched-subunit amino acid permease
MVSGGPFYDTRGLVFASVLLSWGMEMVLTITFLSIFASRIEKKVQARQAAPAQLSSNVQFADQ